MVCKRLLTACWLGGDGEGALRPSETDIRAQASGNPLRRSIIRHMFILIDLSDSMMDKDFRPNRLAGLEHLVLTQGSK